MSGKTTRVIYVERKSGANDSGTAELAASTSRRLDARFTTMVNHFNCAKHKGLVQTTSTLSAAKNTGFQVPRRTNMIGTGPVAGRLK